MDTQNTPIHFRLWHKNFLHIALANLLLTMSMYMLLLVLPVHLLHHGYPKIFVTLCFIAYAVGIYLPGGFLSGLIQRHWRSHVCIVAILAQTAILGYYYLMGSHYHLLTLLAGMGVGCCYGLAQMTMTSTLVIDTCESFLRTEANHASSWFGRLALSVGPFLGFWIYTHLGFKEMILVSSVCSLLSVLLVMSIKFPFKAPEDFRHWFSLDRFFLVHGTPLYLNLILITLTMGLIISTQLSNYFFMVMIAGFLVAILAEKYVFANAELKSETTVGSLLIGFAILLLLLRHENASQALAAMFSGFGIGIIGSRFLLFFIKLACHCERGTSQSTFFLGWETGLALGLALGYLLGNSDWVLLAALAVLGIAFLLYNFAIHPWYMQNKSR